MGPMALRSGTSGLVKSELDQPASNISEDAKGATESPQPEEKQSPNEQPEQQPDSFPEMAVAVMEQIAKNGPITSEKAMQTLAMSLKVRDWAKKLLQAVNESEGSSEKSKPATPPSRRTTEAEVVQAIKDILDDSEDLSAEAHLTHPSLDRLALLIGRALELQGGTDLRLLFRFNVSSLASYFAAGDDLEGQTVIERDDGIVYELREAANLVKTLHEGRGTANAGLTMRDITRLHASAAMKEAWAVLSGMATTAEGVFDQKNRWSAIVRTVESFTWHAERAGFREYHRLETLRCWLADAKGPRVSDLPTRLTNLRNLLFPLGTKETQGLESYEQYGLAILDTLSFENWETPNALSAAESNPATPVSLPALEEASEDDDSPPPAKKAKQKKNAGGPSSSATVSNPIIDRLVRNMMADQQAALNDSFEYF